MQIQGYFTIIHITPGMHKTHITAWCNLGNRVSLAFWLATRWICWVSVCSGCMCSWVSEFISLYISSLGLHFTCSCVFLYIDMVQYTCPDLFLLFFLKWFKKGWYQVGTKVIISSWTNSATDIYTTESNCSYSLIMMKLAASNDYVVL